MSKPTSNSRSNKTKNAADAEMVSTIIADDFIPEEPALSWKQAFLSSPGPTTYLSALWLFLKGMVMGAVDVVPGVSGGTFAFVAGIYSPLVNAISSFNFTALKMAIAKKLKLALSAVHLRFLICLVAGIGTAILLLAGPIQICMRDYPVPTWAFFFGLIVGSIVVVARQVERWNFSRIVALIVGAIAGWVICGLIPVSTPETYWFYFLCGIIGICAMILPGISGAFLLLVLGKYYSIVAAVHEIKKAIGEFLHRDFSAAFALLFSADTLPLPPFWLLTFFAVGEIVGILGFARVLKFLLARVPQITMSCLTGMMIGALRKIYPWRQIIEVDFIAAKDQTKTIRDQMVSPFTYHEPFTQIINTKVSGAADVVTSAQIPGGNPQIGLVIVLAVIGVAIVLLIEHLAKNRRGDNDAAKNLEFAK